MRVEKSLGTFTKTRWAILPLALAIGVSAGIVGCKKGGPEGAAGGPGMGKDGKPQETIVSVEVARVSPRPMSASFSGTAALEARNEAQVVAKTSGIAQRVLVEEGQRVSAGQLLVQLEDAQQKLRVQQSSAQVMKLSRSFERAQQLATQKMVSANDVDQLRFDLQNARAALNMAKLDLSYTRVVAPISGVVASRSIKTGNLVQISNPIFRIVDTNRLEATLNVPERNVDVIRAGLPVQLSLDAVPGQVFNGTVARVSPVVDSGSGTFRVVAAFNDSGVLQPGMFGRINIVFDQKADALAIPRSALLEDEGETAVFTVRGDKAARVSIKTGYADGEWIEVVSGLKLNDPVVTAGKAALRDGVKVQVINGGKVVAPASAPAAAAGKTP
ncbi:efflux RND transporter periplasmic adaptor subunit [Lysobacter sp. HDW10]|uniref:efflux RND transporter periplasmic adaptor subunit n=1 Tax=Lysobacter sp. HDW10 TaxID=2714936 RepID=UPI001F0CFBC9|nr:efflux RND transporter periplasmic adaptor subunit [Lysobacter sp. HDW10]